MGLDMDGFTLSGQIHPFVCHVLGVLADEATFERGYVAHLLRLQARAERRSANHADMVLTTSDYSAQRIAQLYGVDRSLIGVVPPAFDVAQWQSDFAGVSAGLDASAQPTVLCVAHMYPRKDVRTLIGAARRLTDAGRSLEVRIVGGGPERGALQRAAAALGLSEVVQFTGQLSHSDLMAEFAGCDVFCLPSLQEGFGIAFLEAMASGKPVVAAKATSTAELIEDGVNGLLAQPRDENDLAMKIARCLDNPDLCSQMGEANRIKAARYDVKRTTARLLDLVSEIL
jgi:glycosyltransferase involved in cell wall biosynthesis